MAAASEVTRATIRAEGLCRLDGETHAQTNYPLRLSRAICMSSAAVGTAMASPAVLWALTPFAALGAVFLSHLSDVITTRRILAGRLRRRLPCRVTRRSDDEESNVGAPCVGLRR